MQKANHSESAVRTRLSFRLAFMEAPARRVPVARLLFRLQSKRYIAYLRVYKASEYRAQFPEGPWMLIPCPWTCRRPPVEDHRWSRLRTVHRSKVSWSAAALASTRRRPTEEG